MTWIDGNGRAYVQGLVQGKIKVGTRLGTSGLRRSSYEATSARGLGVSVRGHEMVKRRAPDPDLAQAVRVFPPLGNAKAGSASMAPATSSNFGSV